MLSIKYKFSLILLLVISLFVVVGVWVAQSIIFPPFKEADFENSRKNLYRGINALLDEVDQLESVTIDWAEWDDTYSYINKPNDSYEKSNLVASTFENYDIDVIVMMNKYNELAWGGFLNRDLGTRETFVKPVELNNSRLVIGSHKIDLQSLRKKSGVYSGVYIDDSFSMLFAISSITNTEGDSPNNGKLLMARFITERQVNALQQQTDINFSVFPLLGKPLSDFQKQLVHNLAVSEQSIVIEEQGNVTAYSLIASANGAYLLASASLDNSLQGLGENIVSKLIIGLLLGAVLIFLGAVALTRIFVLRPVANLAKYTREVCETGDYSLRFKSYKGKDELGMLSEDIESFVNRLGLVDEELEHLQEVRSGEKQYCHDLESHLQKGSEQLKQLALQDSLTGLANQRVFDEKLLTEWYRLRRYKRHLTIVLVTVDDFDEYQKRYNEAECDRALCAIGGVLKNLFKRAGDIVARYGEKDFAVILPECPPESGIKMGEEIVNSISALGIEHESSELGVMTVSVGVCATLPDETMEVEEVLGQACENLYKAAATGRNQSWFTVMRKGVNAEVYTNNQGYRKNLHS